MWKEQWGCIDPYNLITTEQYLQDMKHVINDRERRKKVHHLLPYLFTVRRYKIFLCYRGCLFHKYIHSVIYFRLLIRTKMVIFRFASSNCFSNV